MRIKHSLKLLFFLFQTWFRLILDQDSCQPYIENGLCFYRRGSYQRFASAIIRPYSRVSSLNECIRRCKNDARCKSFFHVRSTGLCVLMSALCEKSDSTNYSGIDHYDINTCTEGKNLKVRNWLFQKNNVKLLFEKIKIFFYEKISIESYFELSLLFFYISNIFDF